MRPRFSVRVRPAETSSSPFPSSDYAVSGPPSRGHVVSYSLFHGDRPPSGRTQGKATRGIYILRHFVLSDGVPARFWRGS